MSELTDEEILAILKEIDPATQRLPSGFRDFAHAIIWTLKARAVVAAWNTRTAPALQDGWKLVPIEPTQDMLPEAWRTANFRIGAVDHARLRQIYRDMVGAAPEPKP